MTTTTATTTAANQEQGHYSPTPSSTTNESCFAPKKKEGDPMDKDSMGEVRRNLGF